MTIRLVSLTVSNMAVLWLALCEWFCDLDPDEGQGKEAMLLECGSPVFIFGRITPVRHTES